jgi:hypothetical protein
MKISNGELRFFLTAGLLGALGCGLSEYQQKYEKQQERMNYLDQENQYLGSPLNVPAPKESKNVPPKVYLRLPLGISPNYNEKPEGILYRYPKSGSKIAADSNVKPSEIDSAFFAVETDKDWNEFKKRALEPFQGVDLQNVRTVNLEVPGRPPKTFQTITFRYGDDPSWTYQFYFYKDDVYRMAIGFRGMDKVMASDNAKQAMEYSVKTLAIGKEVNR